jgi:diguanylate cyclase (GGDEF)-like protein
MNKKWTGWSLSTKWTLAYALLIILVSATMTLTVYFQLVNAQRQALRDRLSDILKFSIPLVDGDYHSLILLPADQNSPFYNVINQRLRIIKNTSQIIRNIYTLREQEDGQIQYIVDVFEKDPHNVGDPFVNNSSILSNGFTNIIAPIIEDDLLSDENGTYLRGYTPIYDQFGMQNGILVMEVDASIILNSENNARRVALFTFLGMVSLSLVIGWRLAKAFTAPVIDLVIATEHVGQGNLKELVPVRSRDELGLLANTFNHMTTQLRQTMDGLEEEIKKYQMAEKVQDAIFRISQAVISTDTINDMYHSIHAILGELIPVDNFYIAIYDPAENTISYPYFVDQYDEQPVTAEPAKNLTEYVMRLKKPLLLTREKYEKLLEKGEVERIGTIPVDWLGAPLIVEGRTLGVAVVQSYSEKIRFNKDNLNLMAFISTQIALAIEHKWAAEMLQKSNERYRVLFENSPISLWEEDFSGVKRIVDETKKQGVSDFRNYFSDHPEILKKCVLSVKVLDINQASLELFNALSKEEILNNIPYIFSDETLELFKDEFINISQGETAFNCEGMKKTLDGRLIEVSLSWTVVPGYENDLSKVIVSLIDITERRMVEKKLLYISSHDGLTGLYNRAFFDEEMARLDRSRQFPISVIMVDVDSLKWTNDRDGHAAGDAILQKAANVLNIVFRAEDVVARIGGDEFAILLPTSDAESAQKAIERIRNKVEINNATQAEPRLSISLGYSTAESAGSLSAALIDADANMYAEKYSKREIQRASGLKH